MSARLTFEELLDGASAEDFAADPRPGWAGLATLFGAPVGKPREHAEVDFVIAGIPFDSTASSRPGAAEGPAAIRGASRAYAAYIDSLGEHEMLDTRTGKTFNYRRPHIADAGDLHVYPTDLKRNFKALASETCALCEGGSTLVLLGGDHSISFPLFAGVGASLGVSHRCGYIQIDHHFDFGTHSAIHGPVYHGSNARRISEIGAMEPARMAFVGVGSPTRKDQYDRLKEQGYHIVTAAEIRRHSPVEALTYLVRDLANRCTAVYLSIDIDVVEAAGAPGTGGLTVGGLDPGSLLDVLECLSALPVVAVDLVEVAPRYDPTGRTALLAARLLFELIFHYLPLRRSSEGGEPVRTV